MEAQEALAMTAAEAAADTMPKMFAHCVAAHGPLVALRQKQLGVWHGITWDEFGGFAREVGMGLVALGFAPGECASVLSNTNREWLYADMGILCSGGVSSGIYPTDSAVQVEYLINDSRTRVVFAEDEEQLDKLLSCRSRCPTLEKIVVFDMEGLAGFSDSMVLSLAEFMALGQNHRQGREALWDEIVGSRRTDEPAAAQVSRL